MSDYQLTMSVESTDRGAAKVRVWIDPHLKADLSSEQELDLVQDDESSWSGLFSYEGEAFMYRIGICAPPGSCWSLSVRDRRDGNELFFDSDRLTMAKEWLVGSCNP